MQPDVEDSYLVKTVGFEGPLDLLLTLIEDRKLSISEVALASVADAYTAHVRALERVPVGETAQFVLTAATLLLIKSRSLLPTLDFTSEEEGDIRDLEERLRRLAVLRESARELARLAAGPALYARRARVEPIPIFAPGSRLTMAVIVETVQGIVSSVSSEASRIPETLVRRTVHLEEVVRTLAERIERAFAVSFSDIRAASRDRLDLIVSFLALLELVRRGGVAAAQEAPFADITIEGDHVGVPRYD
ncbi:MAG: ScpA family protein [bacterium]|nr:ScpA family protein [bacterium]MDZ4285188.1 ScpA family protein [Patescibacteria group bacterium]